MSLLKDLKELSPALLGGVPGVLSTIVARWPADAREEVRSASWPRMIVTGGERLTSPVRSHLKEVFGAEVVDMYASEEFNLIAMQCRVTGAYHVSDETVGFEILDGTNSVMPGETGQPAGTALHSFAAPLIRFPLGDLVTMGATHCECGMPHSTIKEIQGRVVHFLELPDGFVIHHVKIEQAVGYEAEWARQVQVSQPRVDILALRIAPFREPSAREIDSLRVSVEQYLHDRVTVEVIIDPDLGPKDGEKFRPIVKFAKRTAV
jgi:phenylacetate-CoA ligase